MLTNERDPRFQMLDRRRLEIGGRQMKEVNPGRPQPRCIVTAFGAQIDNGTDAVPAGKLMGSLDRKRTADRQSLRQPVEIRNPLSDACSIFFINGGIFFFISHIGAGRFYCCSALGYCRLHSQRWNNKASQLFRDRMNIHCNPEPIRG